VPEEVEMLKEIEAQKKRLDACRDEDQKDRLRKEISDKTIALNMLLERHNRRR